MAVEEGSSQTSYKFAVVDAALPAAHPATSKDRRPETVLCDPEYSDEPTILVKRIPYGAAKRGLDLLIAGATVVFFLPIWLLIALLIKLTSRGPVFYKQARIGCGGKQFLCYKFRSMADGAEARQDEVMKAANATDQFKVKNDPRVTPLGKVLRKFSLDEFPQLINVFKGEMSIVGPRPLAVKEAQLCTDLQQQRHAVPPGLTCYWQISGRSDMPYDQRMQLDLDYVREMSFWGDVRIILLTFPAVVKGEGAY